ncbi:MAG: class GN sortase [Agarilytica sp.]
MLMKSKYLYGFCFCAAMICFGNSLFVYAKAKLAQILIANTWKNQLANNNTAKPWPWADTWPAAKMRLPKSELTLYILAGAHGESLAFGPGLMQDGANFETAGTKLIAGHRDTHFSFLENVKAGERVSIQNRQGHWKTYAFRKSLVVNINDGPWQFDSNVDAIHFITCFPFDSNIPGGPLRLVAIAEPV